ncbi:uncharacterized protein LTR77_009743 [Saxophila tyrrhenica]|uniref:BTB domain-containing protein n=1 Tax=Saxophila tyrrhenica TaxID=1690608 RepID=A0AAV9NZW2_9PEZI|nr:hypothetical protein LTR77_009743 [Saxophila tyrrhenica]
MDEVSKLASHYEGDELITIAPEGTTRTFKVQKALLMSASNHFAKALSNFKEGHSRTLVLPRCDVETLELLLYWLTLRALPDPAKVADSMIDGSPDFAALVPSQELRYVRLWIFADSICVPE